MFASSSAMASAKKSKPIKDNLPISHQEEQVMVTINELPNENLRMILKYGLVEDVVSKERVSTRFGSIADSILATKSIFTTHMILPEKLGENCFDGVLKTIEKMKQLKDVSSLNVDLWEKIRIKKLAAANQGLAITGTHLNRSIPNDVSQSCCLEYLDCVKELNPNYSGKGVQYEIIRAREGLADHVSRLREKYPELHLFIRYTNTPIDLYIGIEYAGLHSYLPYQFRPYVKNLILSMVSFEPRDLAHYKNIESIFLQFNNLDSFTIGMISPYIVSKLRKLVIDCWLEEQKETCSVLFTEKLSGLRQVIDSHPLVELHFSDPREIVHDRAVIRMILDSPMRTIKLIKLKSITIKRRSIDLAPQFNCRDLLHGLLNRFKSVDKVTIPCTYYDHDWVDEICSQVVLSNKRRTFMVSCVFPGEQEEKHGDTERIF